MVLLWEPRSKSAYTPLVIVEWPEMDLGKYLDQVFSWLIWLESDWRVQRRLPRILKFWWSTFLIWRDSGDKTFFICELIGQISLGSGQSQDEGGRSNGSCAQIMTEEPFEITENFKRTQSVMFRFSNLQMIAKYRIYYV